VSSSVLLLDPDLVMYEQALRTIWIVHAITDEGIARFYAGAASQEEAVMMAISRG
jgi:hypothetical protein